LPRRLATAKRGDHTSQIVRHHRWVVARSRCVGTTVPALIDHDHIVVGFYCWATGVQQRPSSEKPCANTTGGLSPPVRV
jgi:hypothetical protein